MVALSAAPMVQIEAVGAPSCPAAHEIEPIIARRLITNAGAAGPIWRLRYQVDEGGQLDFALIDAVGSERLKRRIQISPGDCEAAAVALVAVVERHFRAVGWTSGTPLPPPAPAPIPVAPSPTASASALASSATYLFGLAAGVWLADATRAVGTISAAVDPTGTPLRLGLAILMPPHVRSESLGGGATASERLWPFRLSAGYRREVASWSLTVGPDALLVLGAAAAESITTTQSRIRVHMAVGAGLQLNWALPGFSRRWQVIADGAIHRHVAGRALHIDGAAGTRRGVLALPHWQALLGFGLARTF